MLSLALSALTGVSGLQAASVPPPVGAATRAFFESGPGYIPSEGIPDPHPLAGSSAFWFGRQPVPGFPGVWNVEVRNTGSGYLEKFLFSAPPGPITSPRPALVAFHAFGVSHGDALFHTTFWQEAQARGWYFIAPLGALPNNYGCAAAQINTQVVLELLTATNAIDRHRIFGVGFSMGGGWALSQAARHVDVDGVRFAGLVDHSGSVSLGHVYASEPGVQSILAAACGGTPSQVPFAYQRFSTIDLDPSTLQVGPDSDPARNLFATPILLWETTADPMWDLRKQTFALQADLALRGRAPRLEIVNSALHTWSTLDDHAVCDWFAQLPALSDRLLDGQLLADADGRWFQFRLEQDAPLAFTPLAWSADPAANRLALSGSANLQRLFVDVRDLGLDYLGDLRLDHRTNDGLGDEIVLEGLAVNAPPQWVRLNGLGVPARYDPQAGTLTLPAVNGPQTSRWQVRF